MPSPSFTECRVTISRLPEAYYLPEIDNYAIWNVLNDQLIRTPFDSAQRGESSHVWKMVISVYRDSEKLKNHVFETILFYLQIFCFSKIFFRRNMLRSSGINERSKIKSISVSSNHLSPKKWQKIVTRHFVV